MKAMTLRAVTISSPDISPPSWRDMHRDRIRLLKSHIATQKVAGVDDPCAAEKLIIRTLSIEMHRWRL
jgi:hypothetical protein